jgi:hypothetical protein
MFQKLDLFKSSGEKMKTPTLLGPLERAYFTESNDWKIGNDGMPIGYRMEKWDM